MRDLGTQRTEALVICSELNRMTQLGIPGTARVGESTFSGEKITPSSHKKAVLAACTADTASTTITEERSLP